MNPAIDFSQRHISFEEYLVREENEDERHEYFNGEVVAMAGATDKHELVAGLLFAEIQNRLRGKGCRVYKGDMKLRFQAGEVDLGYYPDIMVVCDPADSHPTVKTRPKLLVEVMSSFKQDHFEKLFVYQQIPSLEEYLVISQEPDRPQAWLYRRETGWKMPPTTTEGEIRLQTIDLTLLLEDLYRA